MKKGGHMPVNKFKQDCLNEITRMAQAEDLRQESTKWLLHAGRYKYSYHFEWLGRPIIQFPQDIIAMQEIIWKVQPDLIIETGVAHGGSLIFYASMLELNAICGGPQNAMVLGIDIEIRAHNQKAIEAHPLTKRIELLEGSSIISETINKVHKVASKYKRILVVLDSNHTRDHVLKELEAYSHLVAIGSYCVVFDTVVEFMPEDAFPDRPWGKGDNPMIAVDEFLSKHPEFMADEMMDAKLMISVAPKGYLKRLE